MDDYIDILKEWQRLTLKPFLFEHIDVLFPEYEFRRMTPGSSKDHWASGKKLDLSMPKKKSPNKTVVYPGDLKFREQGEWGDGTSVMDKLMADRGFRTVYEACEWLNDRYSLSMPKPDRTETRSVLQHRERITELRKHLSDCFSHWLMDPKDHEAAEVLTYIIKDRGFTLEQAQRAGFGFVPKWDRVIRYLTTKKGFTEEEIDEACGVTNDEGWTAVGYTHRLAIPYMSGGECRGFLFRRTRPGDGPKYLASRGLDRKAAFFNIPKTLEEGSAIVIVEGEIDALTATARGFRNVVAIGGSDLSGDRRRQVEDALRRGAGKLIIVPDLDTTKDGRPDYEKRNRMVDLSVQSIRSFKSDFEEIYIGAFINPTDPDSFIRESGEEEFQELLDTAWTWWEYQYYAHINPGMPSWERIDMDDIFTEDK